jgi:hypothetical protein
MPMYRRKPGCFPCVQWWPPEDTRHDPNETPVVRPKPGKRKVGDITKVDMPPVVYLLHTLEGGMRLTPGAWIVTGVKGEKHAVKPDIFSELYEPMPV